MKILLIMDPGIPVPPTQYGGHERLVYMFAEQYTKLGHQVTLLAGPGSHCSGTTVAFGTNDLQRSSLARTKETAVVWKYLVSNYKQFDLIHNFGRLIYLLPVLSFTVKKIMTYGRPVTVKGIKLVTNLPNKNLVFTACSNYCVSTGNVAGNWKTVYNAIDFSKYNLRTEVEPDAPLMFLGRLDKIKGVHTAINAAKASGNSLIIAGNVSKSSDNYRYFKEEIEPLVDNEQIRFVGPLNDEEKNCYLGRAKALLFPIEWDEPFGMVMVEAMACGTPIIAFNRGSVPEVVEDGITGFRVDNEPQMIERISKINTIDRQKCRETAKARFDVSLIAKAYLSI